MNIPPQLLSCYVELLPLLNEVEQRLIGTFTRYAHETGYPFISRVKTIESTAEKLETGRYKSFTDIDDLVALTVIVPTLDLEELVVQFCEKSFAVAKKRIRGATKKSPEVFRFDTTRLYCRMQYPSGIEPGPGPTIFSILFEIQIRTAFEHAWIVATHDLTYKGVDRDWRKMRLASQMKATVEQLDLLTSQFSSLAPCISPSVWQETDRQNALCGMVSRLIEEGIIPSESKPNDLSRFAENVLDLLSASATKSPFPDVVRALEEGFRKSPGQNFPRSATLLQVVIGILSDSRQISGPFKQEYVGHITDDLVDLYPSVRGLEPIFKYN